ncbi:hypothetical protein [Nocardioides sp. InS609-2]|uniref:hypothetical protein n=1 Tax=Nocardioides sp. InS609-2 TaxID=2760705 RepID=UPI0020C0D011|nr:hypothetical protein [Nocardioides sp. InS609-2]
MSGTHFVHTHADVRIAAVADAPVVAEVHRKSRASYYGIPVDAHADDHREAIWAAYIGWATRRTYVAESAGDVEWVRLHGSRARSRSCPGVVAAI